MNGAASTVCIWKSLQYRALERKYSQRFGIPALENPSKSVFRFCLKFGELGLDLLDLHQSCTQPIRISTSNLKPVSRKNLLGFALGKSRFVIDATAGYGCDSILMARMGYDVVAVERHPALAALLCDGLSRAVREPGHLKIQLRFEDAIPFLQRADSVRSVIFLDPMYPSGRKPNVKVRRKIEVLRELVGNDDDFEELFLAALNSPVRRVVLKRPNFAPVLRPDMLTDCFKGNLVRYDIYQSAN